MATVSLYASPVNPTASHRVFSPGGYERWYFEAQDVYRDVRFVAALYSGYPFHPEYLRRYRKYLRHPTRNVPPVPTDYPMVSFAVFRGKELLAQFLMQYPAGALAVLEDPASVRIGSNQFLEGPQPQLRLAGITSKKGGAWAELHAGRDLSGTFTFTPASAAAHAPERAYISPEISSATHRWMVTDPLCQVSGTIRCAGETIEFSGQGYCDQSYGTAPIGEGVKHWMSGYARFEDVAYAFHFVRPSDPEFSDEVHLVEASSSHVDEVPIAYVDAKLSAMTPWGVRYPARINFEDVLVLEAPRLLDSLPYSVQLLYSIKIRGRAGKAYCQIVNPHRAGWPILNGVIQKAIDQSALKSAM